MSAAAVLDEYLDGLLVTAAAPVQVAPATPSTVPAAGTAPAAPSATPAPPAAPAPAPGKPPAPAPALAPTAAPTARAVPAPRMAPILAGAAPVSEAPPPPRPVERSSRWLRLRCASQAYGLELLKVQEVVLPTPLLPLRGTPPAMLGVMNLRGQVVPVMDLGVHLGQAAQPSTPATRFVVLEEKGEILGLRVSAVEDVVTLAEHQVEAPDNTRVGRLHSELFRGIARQSGEPMILLDASCLLAPGAAAA